MKLEWERVWTKVWLMGCREEQIAEAGSYLVTEIGPESILLVRQYDSGVRAFDAIITPPQAAVLAIGATRGEARETVAGAVHFVSVATVTRSADHRAIDGALAARFLNALKDALERPASLEN